MTKDLIVASAQDELGAILQTMTAGHFRHLPIVGQERLIGAISDALQTQIIEGQD